MYASCQFLAHFAGFNYLVGSDGLVWLLRFSFLARGLRIVEGQRILFFDTLYIKVIHGKNWFRAGNICKNAFESLKNVEV